MTTWGGGSGVTVAVQNLQRLAAAGISDMHLGAAHAQAGGGRQQSVCME